MNHFQDMFLRKKINDFNHWPWINGQWLVSVLADVLRAVANYFDTKIVVKDPLKKTFPLLLRPIITHRFHWPVNWLHQSESSTVLPSWKGVSWSPASPPAPPDHFELDREVKGQHGFNTAQGHIFSPRSTWTHASVCSSVPALPPSASDSTAWQIRGIYFRKSILGATEVCAVGPKSEWNLTKAEDFFVVIVAQKRPTCCCILQLCSRFSSSQDHQQQLKLKSASVILLKEK